MNGTGRPTMSTKRLTPLLLLALFACAGGEKEDKDGRTDDTATPTEGSDGVDGVDGSDGTDGADGADGADGSDGGDTGTCEDVDGDATAPAEAVECAAAGGVCVGMGATCTGTVIDVGGCVFSDGSGACCVPPAAAPTGDTCAAKGGTCAVVGGCYLSKSWFVDDGGGCADTFGASVTCCAPTNACEDYGTELCCSFDSAGVATAAYMPYCDRGAVACFESTTKVCEADCQP